MSDNRTDEEVHQDLADELERWFWRAFVLVLMGVYCTAVWMLS